MQTFDTRWEEVHGQTEWGKYPSEDVIRFVARNYYKRVREQVSIVDVGCGGGANTWYLAKEGFDVYAFDGSKSAVEKTKNRIVQEGLEAQFKVADAANTGYGDEQFDVVIDSAVIYANTTSGVSCILDEMYRILKPEGKIFSTGLFSEDTTGFGTGEKIDDKTYRNLESGAIANLETIHFFDEKEIRELWSQKGFKNIKIDKLVRTEYNQEITIGYYIVQAEK